VGETKVAQGNKTITALKTSSPYQNFFNLWVRAIDRPCEIQRVWSAVKNGNHLFHFSRWQ
jgi:hypothetical protein